MEEANIQTKTVTDNKGFIQIPHGVNDLVIQVDVSEREKNVLLLISRLTYGCHSEWATLIKADLICIGIGNSHAKEVLDKLIISGLIIKSGSKDEYRLNINNLRRIVEKHPERISRFKKIIGINIKSRFSQRGNMELPEIVTKNLPIQEVGTYQNGSIQHLPNREVSASKAQGFQATKDILKDKKYINKDIVIGSYKEEGME
ncbi:MAG: replication protein [Patescibacteria group bacterium]